MIIERQHPITGAMNSLDLPITEEQMRAWYAGESVQYAFRNLSEDQREFLMNGLLPGEFDEMFDEEDEDEYNEEEYPPF